MGSRHRIITSRACTCDSETRNFITVRCGAPSARSGAAGRGAPHVLRARASHPRATAGRMNIYRKPPRGGTEPKPQPKQWGPERSSVRFCPKLQKMMVDLPFPLPDWQSFLGPKSQNGQPSLSRMVILFCPKWKSQNGMGIMFSPSLKGRVDRPFPKRVPQRNGRSTKSKTW